MTKSRAIVVTFYNEKKDDWTFFLMLCPPESSALAQTHQMLRTNSWMFTDVASVKMARQVQHEEVNIMMIQKYTSVLPELIWKSSTNSRYILEKGWCFRVPHRPLTLDIGAATDWVYLSSFCSGGTIHVQEHLYKKLCIKFQLYFFPTSMSSPYLEGWVAQGWLEAIGMKASSSLWRLSRTPGLATQTSATISGDTRRGLSLYYCIKEIKNDNTLGLPHPTGSGVGGVRSGGGGI